MWLLLQKVVRFKHKRPAPWSKYFGQSATTPLKSRRIDRGAPQAPASDQDFQNVLPKMMLHWLLWIRTEVSPENIANELLPGRQCTVYVTALPGVFPCFQGQSGAVKFKVCCCSNESV